MSNLTKYYRNKISGMQLPLPSKGLYGGNIDFSINDTDVEIYALSAADEIYIANPDNLITGAAVERIIKSSCPAINDPRNLPIQDADAICLASKRQTYGSFLSLGGECSKCKEKQEYKIEIMDIFKNSKFLPDEMICSIDEINGTKVDLKIYLRPYSVKDANFITIKEFEQNKYLEGLDSSDMDIEEKTTKVFKAIQSMKEMNMDLLHSCIIRIIADGEEITDSNSIKDFMNNVESKIVKLINDKVKEFNKYGLPKTYTVSCNKCDNKDQIPLVYDPSNFFD